VASAYLGGFVNGLLGSGVGSVIVMGLLYGGVPAKVASATSGYQIVFTGAASLIQAFANQELDVDQFGFLFVISLAGSLAGSVLIYFIMQRYQLKRLQIIVLFVLNLLEAIGVFPNAVFDVKYYGWPFMTAVPGFDC
jgi:uncharacterized membrane protein YfcA